MKKFIFALVSATALASPALAADGAPYVGIEGGLIKPRPSDVDRRFSGGQYSDFLDVRHKVGYDLDGVAGYDFGFFRVEGELGYKHIRHKSVEIDTNAGGPLPSGVVAGNSYSDRGRTNVKSAMINALLDFGVAPGTSLYAGGGAGYARVSMTVVGLGPSGSGTSPAVRTDYHLRDNDIAWQLIAGARTAISSNVDLGLKYRYFSAGTLKSNLYGQLGPNFSGARSFVHSHSLLASLIYNFNSPAPPPPVEAAPPPPPPPPPSTQTCPDGSVIDAAATCPVPPPPPPPPPAKGERG